MKQIPDLPDIDSVTKACDELMAYMRNHPKPEIVQALAIVCGFCTRVKKDIQWLETLIATLKGVKERQESE